MKQQRQVRSFPNMLSGARGNGECEQNTAEQQEQRKRQYLPSHVERGLFIHDPLTGQAVRAVLAEQSQRAARHLPHRARHDVGQTGEHVLLDIGADVVVP